MTFKIPLQVFTWTYKKPVIEEKLTTMPAIEGFYTENTESLSDGENNIISNSVAIRSTYGAILTHQW